MAKSNNWTTASESKFAWERDALDFVREQFPERDPYRAWANFESIAYDGSVNEVDLLVFTPQRKDKLSVDAQLDLIRRITEVVRYAQPSGSQRRAIELRKQLTTDSFTA